jgi:hypothetical protein
MTRVLTHGADLLTVWFNLKFECLKAFRRSIMVSPWGKNDVRHGRHCVFRMHVHLALVTKYRRNVFTTEIIDDLRGIFFERQQTPE